MVDLADGRPPARLDVRSAVPVRELAEELRRRLRGHVTAARIHDVIELRQADPGPLRVRLGPLRATWPPSRLSDPVLTVRAVRLGLDGDLDDPSGDLARRVLRIVDNAAFARRPEALLHLARLAVRPGWSVEAATLEAAIAARDSGAPGTAPVAWLGSPLSDLLSAPEAVEALLWLERLAPLRPLAEGVTVREGPLRKALAAREGERIPHVLRALAPAAPERRLRSFRAGARMDYR